MAAWIVLFSLQTSVKANNIVEYMKTLCDNLLAVHPPQVSAPCFAGLLCPPLVWLLQVHARVQVGVPVPAVWADV